MNDLRQHLIDVWAEVKQSVIDGASGADVTIRARGPDPYRAKDINKLEMVQRRAARFAKSDYCRTTSVSKLLDDLGWSTLSDRRKESRLSMFGKAVAGRVSISVV